MHNIKSWGVGGSYVFAKNAQFNVYQSFASKWKDNKNNATDPEEQTRAEFVFAFYYGIVLMGLSHEGFCYRVQSLSLYSL